MWAVANRWPSQSITSRVVPMPSTAGSFATSSPRWWLAVRTASPRAVRGSTSSSSRSSCRMMFIVSAEARSPAAAPPMPSATAISRLLAYPESWLLVRRRPVSVRATYRSLREVISTQSLLQLDDGLAEPDLDAQAHRHRAGDALAAEVRAVRAADVLDEPLLPVGGEPGVPGGHVVVVEPDARVGAAPEQDRLVAERNALAGVGTGDDLEL